MRQQSFVFTTMRDTVFANCEGDFVVTAIKKKKRLDGRLFDELRSIELHFGSDYGCAYVTLGETKVLAQVSCELSEPRNVRKNEGNLFVNVEISDLVCGVFETGHQGHLGVHTNRLIEKCIKDSRCVDLEALCIISEEQAWEIRVDVSVLNYDGNLFTCSSLAALAALAHFKTPHVTLENSGVRIESIKEFEPEPLSLHHYPILVEFAIFGEGDDILLDPTELEEKVCESELVIGMNSFRELCGMHFSGRTTGNRSLIVKASQQAALVAVDLVKLMKSKLQLDNEERKKNRGKTQGLVSAIHLDRILSASQDRNSLRVTRREIEETARSLIEEQKMVVSGMDSDDGEQAQQVGDNEGESEDEKISHFKDRRLGVQLPPMEKTSFGEKWIPSGDKNAWTLPNATLSDDESDEDVGYVKTITDEDRIIDRIELNDSDEEQDTVILGAKEADSETFRSYESDESRDLSSTAILASGRPIRGKRSVSEEASTLPANDSSSYSMTSPSYSSDSSLHTSSTSAGSCAINKPNYNPPTGDSGRPSTSCRIPSPKIRKKLVRAYSPSSPSSNSTDSAYEGNTETTSQPDGRFTSVRRDAFSTNQKNGSRSRHPLSSAISKRKRYRSARSSDTSSTRFKAYKLSSFGGKPWRTQVIKKEPHLEHHHTTLDDASPTPSRFDSHLPSPIYSLSSPSKPPPSPGLDSPTTQSSPVFSSSSPSPSYSPTSPIYSSSLHSISPQVKMPSHSQTTSFKPGKSHSDVLSKPITLPAYSPSSPSKPPPSLSCHPSSTSQHLCSPVYSPSSPSLPCSPSSCHDLSPQHLSNIKKRLSFSPTTPLESSKSIPPPSQSPNLCSKSIPSPDYSPSSPSQQPSHSVPSPVKYHPSPDYTPSSPSKLPPSPLYSPSLLSESPSPSRIPGQFCEERMPYLFKGTSSPAQSLSRDGSENSSPLYSPFSSQSPVYSTGSSSGSSKVVKKRVKLQRTSPTSPGSVVSELVHVGIPGPEEKKLTLYSPSACTRFSFPEIRQSGNGSVDFSVPSPKYSPSSRLISSDISGANIPPYSPSSPSHPPPSPSIDPSSPESPTFTRSSDPESRAEHVQTPEPVSGPRVKSERGEFGSPHYSLDSLSSYSSSSFSSGLPSPSSGSPRYSPSPSESIAQNSEHLTPSPPLSPSITFTSPRVSSSSSSPPPPTNITDPSVTSPLVANLNKDAGIVHPSLVVFSPSVSPDLPQFTPSSPSHQPPSPAYSPSSPSYSSGSCSPLPSNSSVHSTNTGSSSNSHSPTSTHTRTLILEVFIPKSS